MPVQISPAQTEAQLASHRLVSPAIRVQPDIRDRIRSDCVSGTECSSVSKPISHRFDIHLWSQSLYLWHLFAACISPVPLHQDFFRFMPPFLLMPLLFQDLGCVFWGVCLCF